MGVGDVDGVLGSPQATLGAIAKCPKPDLEDPRKVTNEVNEDKASASEVALTPLERNLSSPSHLRITINSEDKKIMIEQVKVTLVYKGNGDPESTGETTARGWFSNNDTNNVTTASNPQVTVFCIKNDNLGAQDGITDNFPDSKGTDGDNVKAFKAIEAVDVSDVDCNEILALGNLTLDDNGRDLEESSLDGIILPPEDDKELFRAPSLLLFFDYRSNEWKVREFGEIIILHRPQKNYQIQFRRYHNDGYETTLTMTLKQSFKLHQMRYGRSQAWEWTFHYITEGGAGGFQTLGAKFMSLEEAYRFYDQIKECVLMLRRQGGALDATSEGGFLASSRPFRFISRTPTPTLHPGTHRAKSAEPYERSSNRVSAYWSTPISSKLRRIRRTSGSNETESFQDDNRLEKTRLCSTPRLFNVEENSTEGLQLSFVYRCHACGLCFDRPEILLDKHLSKCSPTAKLLKTKCVCGLVFDHYNFAFHCQVHRQYTALNVKKIVVRDEKHLDISGMKEVFIEELEVDEELKENGEMKATAEGSLRNRADGKQQSPIVMNKREIEAKGNIKASTNGIAFLEVRKASRVYVCQCRLCFDRAEFFIQHLSKCTLDTKAIKTICICNLVFDKYNFAYHCEVHRKVATLNVKYIAVRDEGILDISGMVQEFIEDEEVSVAETTEAAFIKIVEQSKSLYYYSETDYNVAQNDQRITITEENDNTKNGDEAKYVVTENTNHETILGEISTIEKIDGPQENNTDGTHAVPSSASADVIVSIESINEDNFEISNTSEVHNKLTKEIDPDLGSSVIDQAVGNTVLSTREQQHCRNNTDASETDTRISHMTEEIPAENENDKKKVIQDEKAYTAVDRMDQALKTEINEAIKDLNDDEDNKQIIEKIPEVLNESVKEINDATEPDHEKMCNSTNNSESYSGTINASDLVNNEKDPDSVKLMTDATVNMSNTDEQPQNNSNCYPINSDKKTNDIVKQILLKDDNSVEDNITIKNKIDETTVDIEKETEQSIESKIEHGPKTKEHETPECSQNLHHVKETIVIPDRNGNNDSQKDINNAQENKADDNQKANATDINVTQETSIADEPELSDDKIESNEKENARDMTNNQKDSLVLKSTTDKDNNDNIPNMKPIPSEKTDDTEEQMLLKDDNSVEENIKIKNKMEETTVDLEKETGQSTESNIEHGPKTKENETLQCTQNLQYVKETIEIPDGNGSSDSQRDDINNAQENKKDDNQKPNATDINVTQETSNADKPKLSDDKIESNEKENARDITNNQKDSLVLKSTTDKDNNVNISNIKPIPNEKTDDTEEQILLKDDNSVEENIKIKNKIEETTVDREKETGQSTESNIEHGPKTKENETLQCTQNLQYVKETIEIPDRNENNHSQKEINNAQENKKDDNQKANATDVTEETSNVDKSELSDDKIESEQKGSTKQRQGGALDATSEGGFLASSRPFRFISRTPTPTLHPGTRRAKSAEPYERSSNRVSAYWSTPISSKLRRIRRTSGSNETESFQDDDRLEKTRLCSTPRLFNVEENSTEGLQLSFVYRCHACGLCFDRPEILLDKHLSKCSPTAQLVKTKCVCGLVFDHYNFAFHCQVHRQYTALNVKKIVVRDEKDLDISGMKEVFIEELEVDEGLKENGEMKATAEGSLRNRADGKQQSPIVMNKREIEAKGNTKASTNGIAFLEVRKASRVYVCQCRLCFDRAEFFIQHLSKCTLDTKAIKTTCICNLVFDKYNFAYHCEVHRKVATLNVKYIAVRDEGILDISGMVQEFIEDEEVSVAETTEAAFIKIVEQSKSLYYYSETDYNVAQNDQRITITEENDNTKNGDEAKYVVTENTNHETILGEISTIEKIDGPQENNTDGTHAVPSSASADVIVSIESINEDNFEISNTSEVHNKLTKEIDPDLGSSVIDQAVGNTVLSTREQQHCRNNTDASETDTRISHMTEEIPAENENDKKKVIQDEKAYTAVDRMDQALKTEINEAIKDLNDDEDNKQMIEKIPEEVNESVKEINDATDPDHEKMCNSTNNSESYSGTINASDLVNNEKDPDSVKLMTDATVNMSNTDEQPQNNSNCYPINSDKKTNDIVEQILLKDDNSVEDNITIKNKIDETTVDIEKETEQSIESKIEHGPKTKEHETPECSQNLHHVKETIVIPDRNGNNDSQKDINNAQENKADDNQKANATDINVTQETSIADEPELSDDKIESNEKENARDMTNNQKDSLVLKSTTDKDNNDNIPNMKPIPSEKTDDTEEQMLLKDDNSVEENIKIKNKMEETTVDLEKETGQSTESNIEHGPKTKENETLQCTQNLQYVKETIEIPDGNGSSDSQRDYINNAQENKKDDNQKPNATDINVTQETSNADKPELSDDKIESTEKENARDITNNQKDSLVLKSTTDKDNNVNIPNIKPIPNEKTDDTEEQILLKDDNSVEENMKIKNKIEETTVDREKETGQSTESNIEHGPKTKENETLQCTQNLQYVKETIEIPDGNGSSDSQRDDINNAQENKKDDNQKPNATDINVTQETSNADKPELSDDKIESNEKENARDITNNQKDSLVLKSTTDKDNNVNIPNIKPIPNEKTDDTEEQILLKDDNSVEENMKIKNKIEETTVDREKETGQSTESNIEHGPKTKENETLQCTQNLQYVKETIEIPDGNGSSDSQRDDINNAQENKKDDNQKPNATDINVTQETSNADKPELSDDKIESNEKENARDITNNQKDSLVLKSTTDKDNNVNIPNIKPIPNEKTDDTDEQILLKDDNSVEENIKIKNKIEETTVDREKETGQSTESNIEHGPKTKENETLQCTQNLQYVKETIEIPDRNENNHSQKEINNAQENKKDDNQKANATDVTEETSNVDKSELSDDKIESEQKGSTKQGQNNRRGSNNRKRNNKRRK